MIFVYMGIAALLILLIWAAISLFLNHSKLNKDSPENWFWRFLWV